VTGDLKDGASLDAALQGIETVITMATGTQRVGGPASYIWTEIVNAISQANAAPLLLQYLPMGSEVPLLSPEVGSLLNGMETYESFIDMTETTSANSVELTPLDKFIQRASSLSPARQGRVRPPHPPRSQGLGRRSVRRSGE
jgi:hypothetical protein